MLEKKKEIEIIKNEDLKLLDYDLGPAEGIIDHDQICMSQANKLLQIGYLEYETAFYGSAYYKKDGSIHYYISAREESMDKFLTSCYQQNIYPTPAEYFVKRYNLLNDTQEEIKAHFRLFTAYTLKKNYPPILFQALQSLSAEECANCAFEIMAELAEQLENCFDLNQLQLFANLTEMLFRGRQLRKESYILLNQWLKKEQEKISAEPIVSGNYCRTFSGFAYQREGGEVKYFIDALPYLTKEKQIQFIAQGCVVSPILSITYYADSFHNLQKQSKEAFRVELSKYVGGMYMKLMAFLKQLPSGVDRVCYNDYYEKIQAANSRKAMEIFLYYGYLWNVKR